MADEADGERGGVMGDLLDMARRSAHATVIRAKRPKRPHNLNMRLSEDEAAALDRCADRWGLSYSELVRMWLRQDERQAMEDGAPARAEHE